MASKVEPNTNVITLGKGDLVEVEITKIANFGAFVRLPNKKSGLIHISQISDNFVKDINKHLKVGDKAKAKILEISPDGKIDLTLKKEKEAFTSFPKGRTFKNSPFEGKIKIF